MRNIYLNTNNKILSKNGYIITDKEVEIDEPFLTFQSVNSFTLNISDNKKYWDGTLQYSTDKSTWTNWTGTTSISSASDGTNHNIFIRGIGNTIICGASASGSGRKGTWELNGTNISIIGNIENLLDYSTVILGNHPPMGASCFRCLFAYTSDDPNSNITDISKFKLPALTLSEHCYRAMFQGCSGITTIPENLLPARTLATYCYSGMFFGCFGLTNVCNLPAVNLDTYCYSGLFRYCAITSVPKDLLNAKELKDHCYWTMFGDCTQLTTVPNLPAKTLAQWCYVSMFSGCTSLIAPPKLDALDLADYAYYNMFIGCTNLETLPNLPSDNIPSSCYMTMFQDCTKIKLSTTQTGDYQTPYKLPENMFGTIVSGSLNDMFTGTGGTFTGTPSINTTYYTSNTVI